MGRGLVAAAAMVFAAPAWAQAGGDGDAGGEHRGDAAHHGKHHHHDDDAAGADSGAHAIEEHPLYATESPPVDPELMAGNLDETRQPDRDTRFIHRHRLEGLGWTHPLLGQDLFPQLAAGTLLTATHDRIAGQTGFQNRVDLDLYWLQVRLPTLSSERGQIQTPDLINFDLLLPWKLCPSMRLGLLVGADLGMVSGGLSGLRYQLAYGVSAGFLDVQARAGYGLETQSFATTGLPEAPPAATGAARQAELLYGAVVGLSWATWGKVALEANGAHLIDARGDLLTLSPGIRLRAGHAKAAELGLAAVLDFNRDSGKSLDLRGAGGMVSLRYTFL